MPLFNLRYSFGKIRILVSFPLLLLECLDFRRLQLFLLWESRLSAVRGKSGESERPRQRVWTTQELLQIKLKSKFRTISSCATFSPSNSLVPINKTLSYINLKGDFWHVRGLCRAYFYRLLNGDTVPSLVPRIPIAVIGCGLISLPT